MKDRWQVMLKNKLHHLVGVMVGTALSYGAISAQWIQQAQGAVLTSNFKVNVFFQDGFTYGGAFNFDDSSLTGQGEESTKVLSGVFNFIEPGRLNKAYDLTNSVVNLLDGKLLGLSASGQAVSREVMMDYTIATFQGPVTIGLHGLIKWSIWSSPTGSRLGGVDTFLETQQRFDKFFDGEVFYSQPEEIESASVPEPTTVVGAALGIVSLVQWQRRRKKLSSV